MRLALVGVMLLLGLATAGQWWLWPAERPRLPAPERPPMTGAGGAQQGPPSEFRRPPLEHYKEVWERPLFVEERRPVEETEEQAVVEEPPPAPPADPPAVTLSAVVIAGDKVTALLTDRATGKVVRKRPGDLMDSWEVAEILAEKVVLTQGSEKLELQLRNFDAAVPAPADNTPRAARSRAAANKRRAANKARRRPQFTPAPPARSSAAAERAAEIYKRLVK